MQLRHVLLILTVTFIALALWREREDRSRQKPRQPASIQQAGLPRRFPRLIVRAEAEGSPVTESFRQLLIEDRFCEVVHLMKGSVDQNLAQFYESLNLDTDSTFGELVSPSGPLLSNPRGRTYNSKAARLLQALKLDGDLSSTKTSLRDPLTAWTLLTQLHTEDPLNAAYLFFRLAIEHDQEYPLEQRIATASELLRATEFNSYMIDLYRETIQRMRENSTKFYAGMFVVSQIPFPTYTRGVAAVRELEFEVPGLSAAVGNLMTSGPLNARDSFKIGGYNLLEYGTGRSLLKSKDLPAVEGLERGKNGPRGDFSEMITYEGGYGIDYISETGECNEAARQLFLTQLNDWL